MNILEVQTVLNSQDIVSKIAVSRETMLHNAESLQMEKSVNKSLKTKDTVTKNKQANELQNPSENIIREKRRNHQDSQEDKEQEPKKFDDMIAPELGHNFSGTIYSKIDLYPNQTINIDG